VPHIPTFWHSLDEAERAALGKVARSQPFSKGMPLCYQGDPTTQIFVVLSGWVKVATSTPDGHEVIRGLRGAGELIGEGAALYGRPRSATLSAMGQVKALTVAADRFTIFLEQHPHAARLLIGTVGHRLDEADRWASAQVSADGAQRLALLLIELAERYGQRIPGGAIVVQPALAQQELAHLIGTSRETAARALRKWREQKIVDTSWKKITIIDPPALRRLASGPQGPRSGLRSRIPETRRPGHR
jgi:CRP-like cAMP-binding protein